MSKYKVTNTTGGASREIEADSYTYDETSGRHVLKQGDELIASLVNVNVEKLPDQPTP